MPPVLFKGGGLSGTELLSITFAGLGTFFPIAGLLSLLGPEPNAYTDLFLPTFAGQIDALKAISPETLPLCYAFPISAVLCFVSNAVFPSRRLLPIPPDLELTDFKPHAIFEVLALGAMCYLVIYSVMDGLALGLGLGLQAWFFWPCLVWMLGFCAGRGVVAFMVVFFLWK